MAAMSADRLRQRWNTLAARERRGVVLSLLVLGLAVLWWGLLAPPLRVLAQADATSGQLEAQLQAMQGLQTRAQALQAQSALRATDALRALQTSVDAMGSKARLQANGERVVVTLQQVDAQMLAIWLTAPQPPSGLQPQQVQLKRDAGQTSWSGSVVFRLPGEAAP